MGFDVTFHSISMDELEYFFFDVVRTPALAEERARRLSNDPQRQEGILQLYEQFPFWLDDGEVGFSESFAFCAAIIAGFLHPYWYARNQALSFLSQESTVDVKRCLTPLSSLAMDAFASKADSDAGTIQANDSGGGIVLPERLPELVKLLEGLNAGERESPDFRVGGVFDAEGWEAVQHAIQYARSKGLALLEAADLVTPFSNECYSDVRNLRARFLENVADFRSAEEKG